MKTFACWCAILISASGFARAEDAEPSAAAAAAPFRRGAGISYWDFSGLEGLDFRGAGGGGIVGQFRLRDSLAFELRLSGYAADETRNITTEDGQHFENDVTIVSMPLEADVLFRLPLGEALSLYGGPGVGYYLFDGQSNSDLGDKKIIYDIEVDDKGGCYVLAGLRARISDNFCVFIEGKYTWVETSIEQAVEVLHDIGIDWVSQKLDFSGPAFNLGLLFAF